MTFAFREYRKQSSTTLQVKCKQYAFSIESRQGRHYNNAVWDHPMAGSAISQMVSQTSVLPTTGELTQTVPSVQNNPIKSPIILESALSPHMVGEHNVLNHTEVPWSQMVSPTSFTDQCT